MAEQTSNGTSAQNVDVEMKEEVPIETTMNNIQRAPQPDLTDPNPAPQPAPTQPTMNLAPIQPAIAAVAAASTPRGSTPATRPGSIPPQPSVRPEKPVAHGGPTRQYLNQNVTPHLLEGMKHLAIYEPEKPLLWLADFLRERSKEIGE